MWSVCVWSYTCDLQYASIGHSSETIGAVPDVLQPESAALGPNDDRGLIMALELRTRAQILSRYLSSRRVTEKFWCSTCLPRTPHCVTVNSSRLYEHPRHNRVAQHTNRWTLAHSRVYLIQGARVETCWARLVPRGEIERESRGPLRLARKSRAEPLISFHLLYLADVN